MAGTYDVPAALSFLQAQLGKPYRWAGVGPNAWDCSGLTWGALKAAGYRSVPQSQSQYIQTRGSKLKPTDAPPAGCLLFFGTAGVATHCGMSTGGGAGIFAPHTGTVVQRESIASVRSSFSWYAVTNPLGASNVADLSEAAGAAAAKAGHGQVPPGLGAFMAAERWQESGSPSGNYREPNGQGAYQIIPSSWQAWTRQLGYGSKYPDASSAPKRVQDEVAAAKFTDDYYGPGEKSWRIVARIWNGGSPNVVPNPALGPGATTNTYASAVLAKMQKITGGTAPAGDATAASSSTGPPSGCVHSVDLKLTSVCMDKPLALAAMTGGGILVFGGLAVIIAASFEQTKLGRNATKAAALAFPVGRVASVARATAPKARQARQTAAAARQAKVEAPLRQAQRETAAENRRAETHRAQQARARTAQRRAGQVHTRRLRNLDAQESRRSSAAVTRARARSGRTVDVDSLDPPRPRRRFPAHDTTGPPPF